MEELEKQAQTETTTAIEQEQKQELKLDDLPRLEDLIKSEQDIKSEKKLQGLTDAQTAPALEDRPFTRKEDEHKKFVKKRLKLVTGVYIAIATLLFAFVGVNVATLVGLNKKIDDNVKTIQSQSEILQIAKDHDTPDQPITGEGISITLNQPRDYNDDNQSLNLIDKLTILFRSLFS